MDHGSRFVYWTLCVGLLAAAAAILASNAIAITIYVSADGHDDRLGTSAASSVRSVARAIDIAKPVLLAGDPKLSIVFQPGAYGPATIGIEPIPGFSGGIELLGGNASSRAVFDAGGSPATWLRVVGEPGWPVKLRVQGFHVIGYRKAVVLRADKFDDQHWHLGHRVTDNIFERIGQHGNRVEPSMAAVHLMNTAETTISGNIFRDISNLRACDGLHAIYLTGGTTRNRIEGNRFEGGCGDTIKVRNRSNENLIINNVFVRQRAKALLVDSFCDAATNERCAGKQQECPSWGNIFSDNVVDAESFAAVKAEVRYVGRSEVAQCPFPVARDRIVMQVPSRICDSAFSCR